uniref:Ras-GAP domain-containing protein n=1 Tax=Heterorhabditis bacteriophora TaxID=37862 RepID=A0A1I7X8I8_HETBA
MNIPVQSCLGYRLMGADHSSVANYCYDSFEVTQTIICACQLDLSSIGHKFKSKFPIYLQKGGKDAVLANLVEERLLQCEKKSGAGHWDKVDGLLSKISLSKSEESECRAGLIQERISCVNLLNFACQFVDPSFMFRLVPARITIQVLSRLLSLFYNSIIFEVQNINYFQEARQAENGAEKCRKVVRLVKKRLEG